MWKHWKYKNTLLLIISLILFFYITDTSIGKEFIAHFSKLGLVGAFVGGVFFVSTFTVAPAAVVLLAIAKLYSPLSVAFVAGLGAVIGDYIFFRFLKDRVFDEMKPVFMKLGGSSLTRLLHTPYFAWLAPVVGACIIASPFPDEIGVSLMSISKLKNWQFLILSFLLNSGGIIALIEATKIFSKL